MSCGCGGDSSGATPGPNAPLLTGGLDTQYVGQPGLQGAPVPQSPVDSGLSDVSSMGLGTFTSASFWIVGILVIGAAWYFDSKRKKE